MFVVNFCELEMYKTGTSFFEVPYWLNISPRRLLGPKLGPYLGLATIQV